MNIYYSAKLEVVNLIMNTLSPETIATVKSTAPLLAEKGPIITETFYERMFAHNPELLDIFNKANQRKGTQAQALFGAVLAYANNIDNLEVLGKAVNHIAHKHTSLGIKPAQYEIVGGHLLATIQEIFALPDDHEILSAWAEAYGFLANIFINAEESIYSANESKDNGWRDFKTCIVKDIIVESPTVKSFIIVPADGSDVPSFKGGQYLSVKVKPHDHPYEEIRQYSLSSYGNSDHFRISTKREPHGVVTNFMHDLEPGARIEVNASAGVFTLDETAKDHVFIGGGIGMTAVRSLYQHAASLPNTDSLTFIQCTQDQAHEVFREEILSISDSVNYKLLTSEDHSGDAHGFINEELLAQWISNRNAAFYLCGPHGFMKATYHALLNIGVAAEQIHYEVFGPNASLED